MKNNCNRSLVILLAVVIVSCLAYLLTSHFVLKIGFPLDDAWIHQTFARSFAQTGQWAFLEGQPAGGSTSPLWTFLLSLGYIFRLPFVFWAFFIGAVLLFLTGLVGEKIIGKIAYSKEISNKLPLPGLMLITEWHLIWAALSGMETLLLSFLVLLSAYLLAQEKANWLIAGLLAGLMIWVRPDGILVLGPIVLLALVRREKRPVGLRLARVGLGFVLLVVPYLIFNLQVAGEIWPTTFFAKQAEYAALRQWPIFARSMRLYSQLLVGVGVAFLPGFVYSIYRAVVTRNWWRIAHVLWVVGYVFVYVMRLPVIYQHARYLIPAMPLFLLIGYNGYLDLRCQMSASGYFLGLVNKFWGMSIIAVAVLFMVIGARAYSMDVAIIETEMVKAAKWVKENTPQESLIAAHDIGALGYFGDREILDLAGLIEPEVIPFIRDEYKLGVYIQERGADYLFTFPGWYPDLTRSVESVYSTNSDFSPEAGGENIHIYELER